MDEQTTISRSKQLHLRSEDLMKKTRGKIDPTISTRALVPHDMHRLWGTRCSKIWLDLHNVGSRIQGDS
jgi:hypothetical protein